MGRCSASMSSPLCARLQERHHAGDESAERKQLMHGIISKWRQKEKLKTTAVALVLCLNIGVDPPDVIKISPCARLECWVDPMSMQPAKALETIGARATEEGAVEHACMERMGPPGTRCMQHARGSFPSLTPLLPPDCRTQTQARTCRPSTNDGSRVPSTRCTSTPRWRTSRSCVPPAARQPRSVLQEAANTYICAWASGQHVERGPRGFEGRDRR